MQVLYAGSIVMTDAVRADGGHAPGILEEPIRPEEPIVHKLILERAGGIVPPERIQPLDGPVSVVHQLAVPGQQAQMAPPEVPLKATTS